MGMFSVRLDPRLYNKKTTITDRPAVYAKDRAQQKNKTVTVKE
jgi:hypothetical protein